MKQTTEERLRKTNVGAFKSVKEDREIAEESFRK